MGHAGMCESGSLTCDGQKAPNAFAVPRVFGPQAHNAHARSSRFANVGGDGPAKQAVCSFFSQIA
jgi:hypothetical protein